MPQRRRRKPKPAACPVCPPCPVPAPGPVPPAPAPPAPHRFGVGLNEIAHYSSERVFADIFKQSKPWTMTEPNGAWNPTIHVPTDANGWPVIQPGESCATIMLNGIGGNYPGGDYYATWRGRGRVRFAGDARATYAGNSAILTVTPTNAGIVVRVEESSLFDPVRNIEISQGENPGVFDPQFLADLRDPPCDVIRFLDWGRVNNHGVPKFVPLNNATQAGDEGVAPEFIPLLCNVVQAAPWCCIPHLADDAWVGSFARKVHDLLEPQFPIYVEWSNEVWNSIFSQASYAIEQGVALGLDPDRYRAGHKFHARRSVEVFRIFAAAAKGRRVIRVMAGQHGHADVLAQRLAAAGGQVDVAAIAPYFKDAGGAATTVDTILGLCQADIDGRCKRLIQENRAVTGGLPLIAYEGGQHLWAPTKPELWPLYNEANKHPRMGDLYRRYLAMWSESGGGLMLHMNSVRYPSKDGAWGLRGYTGDKGGAKLAAVREWVDG